MSTLPTPDAEMEAMVCGAATQVTPADSARLPVAGRPDGGMWRPVDCELAVGHDGSHVGFLTAVDGGDQWWWLRWAPQSREVVQIDPCAVEDGDGEHPDDCLLPGGHLGPHSFELPPVAVRVAPPVLH